MSSSLIPEYFDPTRTDRTGGPVEECDSWYIDVSPGDMTRYRLLCSLSPCGTLLVHWLGSGLTYTTTMDPGEWLERVGGQGRCGKGGEYDRTAISRILDEHVRQDR